MVVLGVGAIGVTFAQMFSRFGFGVTLVERASLLLQDAEPEVSAVMAQGLQEGGVRVFTEWEGAQVRLEEMERLVTLRREGKSEQ